MYLKEVGSKVIRCRFEIIRSFPKTCNTIIQTLISFFFKKKDALSIAHTIFELVSLQLTFLSKRQSIKIIYELLVSYLVIVIVVNERTNLIKQQYQMRMSEKFVGADTRKQL